MASQPIYVGAIKPCTEAMGPGKRACIWVTGCSIRCADCATPEFLERSAGSRHQVDELSSMIVEFAELYGLEGISLSGGEPFEQAEPLARLLKVLKGNGLSTISWTGYRLNFLHSARAPSGASSLLEQLDVLIDGPFVRSKIGTYPLHGSSNQRIIRLTEHYNEDDFSSFPLEVEMMINEAAVVSGVADMTEVKQILKVLGICK